jgi:Metallo-peptidase family M12/Secretion system C-terminal sorting domain
MKLPIYSFFLFFCLTPLLLVAQDLSPVAQKVENYRSEGVPFQNIAPFGKSSHVDEVAKSFATDGQMLKMNKQVLKQLLLDKPQAISVMLPFHDEVIRVEMVRANVLSDDFTLITSASDGAPVPFQDGLHYRGYLPNEQNSVAAFSFSENDIMGIIAEQGRGNIVLGKLDVPQNTSNYIMYSENALSKKSDFKCESRDGPKVNDHVPLAPGTPEVNGCVRVYFEADFQLFTNKGSVSNTLTYLTGAFNQMATLYNNITVSTVLSQVFIWVEADPYPFSDSELALDAFELKRTNFNADLAHLVTLDNNGNGGIAYVGVICSPSNYAYSEINSSYNNVPTYSWTIEVLTHEMGHNLGSKHTQWCGWTAVTPTGALDNCFTPEGGCAPGAAPVGGGTIMSYCHLNGTGINFANGFGLWNGGTGTQPRNAIWNEVTTGACLTTACATNSCGAPTTLSASAMVANSATLSWTAVSGATGYNVQHRVVGTSAWTTVSNVTSPLVLNSLPIDAEVELAIQSICASGTSDYLLGIIINTQNAACLAPTFVTSSAVTATTASINWTENSGNTTWDIYYSTSATTPIATTTPTIAGVTTKPRVLTGLTSSTTYYVYVRSSCAGGVKSSWSTEHSFGTQFDCNLIPTVSENVDFVINVAAGNGAFDLNGTSPTNSCGWSTPGIEAYFKFTPTQSGFYVFQVTGSTQYLDYFYKVNNNTCNASGFTCIDDLVGSTSRGIGMLTAGTTYLFLADSEVTDAFSSTIKIHRTTSVMNPNSTTCTALSTIGTFDIDGVWYLFGNGSGQIAGAIKSTSALPGLSIQMADNPTSLSHYSQFYMPRYLNITATTPPSGLVDIVLLHRNDELALYNTASSNSSILSSLEISYYDGVNEDCTPSNNTSGTLGTIPVTTSFSYDANTFGLHFRTNHFTEFAVAESFVSLPLELLDFKAKALAKANQIEWKVAEQRNVLNHTIERSLNGQEWKPLHEVAITSESTEQSFRFEDTDPKTRTYYRLRFTEQDGKQRYSQILLVERKDKGIQIVNAYPNPADQLMQVTLNSPDELEVMLEIVNTLGQVVATQRLDVQNGQTDTNVSVTDLPSGTYRMQLKSMAAQQILQTLPITVQH